MNTSTVELTTPLAEKVTVTADTLTVELRDGRSISVPLDWYPRLLHAKRTERRNYRLIAKGKGIHWEGLEEDISISSLLAGRPSGESRASFGKWLNSRETKPR